MLLISFSSVVIYDVFFNRCVAICSIFFLLKLGGEIVKLERVFHKGIAKLQAFLFSFSEIRSESIHLLL